MIDPTLAISADVAATERAAVLRAAERLNESLRDAAKAPFRIELVPTGSPKALRLTSLAHEVDAEDAWPVVEARLRARYAALAAEAEPVFVLTVFRCVRSVEAHERSARLVRIRRLNLLAANLSHDHGIMVVDIDRALADLGAARIQADYRLAGAKATDAAARVIALALLSEALEPHLSGEIQDAVRAGLLAGEESAELPAAVRPQQLMALGGGRRRRTVSIEPATAELRHLFLLRQILKGRIRFGDAVTILLRAVRHVGPERAAPMLLDAMRRLVGSR